MTFIVRGTRGDDAATAVRLRAETAVAKARDLVAAGWHVFIECPAGIRNYPDDFENLLSDSESDNPQQLRHCACRKSNPDIFVMQSAEDWAAKNTPCPLNSTR